MKKGGCRQVEQQEGGRGQRHTLASIHPLGGRSESAQVLGEGERDTGGNRAQK